MTLRINVSVKCLFLHLPSPLNHFVMLCSAQLSSAIITGTELLQFHFRDKRNGPRLLLCNKWKTAVTADWAKNFSFPVFLHSDCHGLAK